MFHVKLVEVAFNQEKDLVGTFSIIVKLQYLRRFVYSCSGGGGGGG